MKTLKSKIRLFVFLLLITGSQISFAVEFGVSGSSYVDNMDTTWTINLGVNRPVFFNIYVSIEDGYDFLYIYALDDFNNDILVKTLTGHLGMLTVSTIIPTGKAKVVFISDEIDSNNAGWAGFGGTYEVDNNPDIDDMIYTGGNSYIGGNSYLMGNVGIGTTSPNKRFEIWDGSSGKFTFSAASCTSGYETAHTIDNTGYKINVGNSLRDFRVAVSGVDKFKILKNENYALGTGALNSTSFGYNNIALGANSLNKTYGYENLGLGINSLFSNTTGNYNIGLGSYSLYALTSGSYNIALGYYAGRYISNGTTANQTSSYSVFIGARAKAQASSQSNQIVIGYNAVGNGSNTVTMGDDNIVKTILKGNVGLGIVNPLEKLDVVGNIRINEYSPQIILQRTSVEGGFTQGIQTRLADGTDNWYFGALHESSFIVSKGYYQNPLLFVRQDGNVGIGTTSPDSKLTVNGKIHAREVIIDEDFLADYVFDPSYTLRPLSEVEEYVNTHRHLPEIPSASNVKANGLNLGEMQNLLLQKIEELTLYAIEQQKQVIEQQKQIDELKKMLQKVK